MAIRKNADGSITVGSLKDEPVKEAHEKKGVSDTAEEVPQKKRGRKPKQE